MFKKYLKIWAALIISLTLVLLIVYIFSLIYKSKAEGSLISPIINTIVDSKKPEGKNIFPIDDINKKEALNVLLLGIDRRSKAETAFRTDSMILLSINPDTNKAVMISVPRDLWAGSGRINAVYIQDGVESLEAEFEKITGIKVKRFILTDFQDFSWIIDAMGGVNVEVQNTFTDTEYPNDETKTYQTISFKQGLTKLDGKDALIFSRSRHGNNGEGSDFSRMARQHLIIKGIAESFFQTGSIFKNVSLEDILKIVTTNRMETNLTITDLYYLFDLYKDRSKYEIRSMYLNSDYVYNPPMSDYGGAWVLVEKDGGYKNFANDLTNYLDFKETKESTPSASKF